MKPVNRKVLVFLFLGILSLSALQAQIACTLYSFSKERLEETKRSSVQTEPVQKLLRDADKALKSSAVYSVVDKKQVPPDGDKHNYMSLARYYWPDAADPDGPYVNKDGQTNPEIKDYPDEQTLNRMCSSVQCLTLAWYFTDRKAYAEKAARLLRAWFLDPATLMRPNMNYSQAIKGKNEGKSSGVLDSRGFIQLLDMVDLLHDGGALDDASYTGLQAWFSSYLDWLDTSKNGKGEQEAPNNHGSWYAAQYARYALFVGRKDLAAAKLDGLKSRIAAQIEPDGKQPLELARTKSLSYSCFNLKALCTAAVEAERLGIDLWTYRTSDGRSIKKALDYILSWAMQSGSYPGRQIVPFDTAESAFILREAALHYPDDKRYQEWLGNIDSQDKENADRILY